MIGISIIVGNNASKVRGLDEIKEPWHNSKRIISHDDITVTETSYDGYPISTWTFNQCYIIVEGLIFNLTDADLRNNLENIVEHHYDSGVILDFINRADGDYCIYVIDPQNKEVIAFNDILGGLPIFYCHDEEKVFISRQFGLIAANLSNKRWSRENIAEFLSFGHNLRNRTFSDNIYKFEPASLLRVSFAGVTKCHYENIYVDDFSLVNPYKSKEEAICNLVQLFDESCQKRVYYAKDHGYRIVNTLSGGFDSRTIVGGLEKITQDYTNITYEYVQDESFVAKEVLNSVNSKSSYIKISFKNTPVLYDVRPIVNTDGRINCFTNSVCYNDMSFVRERLGGDRTLYFGGFGGEFIRHPRFKVLLPFSKTGLAHSPSFYLTSSICNTNVNNLNTLFNNSFSVRMKEENKCKDLYNEYYQNLVRCSGEERTRLFYFTVQPMMGKDFIMAIRHRIPLNWVGYEFYKQFLKALDERLLSVNIYGKNEDYLDDHCLQELDKTMKVKSYYSSIKRYLLRKYTHKEMSNEELTIEYKSISEPLNEINRLHLFNKDYIQCNYSHFSKGLKYQLISVILLISSLEKGNNVC